MLSKRAAMRILLVLAIVGAGLALLARTASACTFDGDCDAGNRCIKTQGLVEGVCVSSQGPGGQTDRKPVYAPLDPTRSYGNSCYFDNDCGSGVVCVKLGGSITGVCMRGDRR
jgi:hypothetical protein